MTFIGAARLYQVHELGLVLSREQVPFIVATCHLNGKRVLSLDQLAWVSLMILY